MSKPVVAIVGRPNVGKSTLFNTLAGERISIVKDTPGVTRDRIYADVTWLNYNFTLIDTGGIEPDSGDIILSQMREQAEIAIATADVILFIVDVRQGMTDSDSKVADMLRRSHKPVVLVVNKVDNFEKLMPDVYEFYNLGIGDPVPISAVGKLGIGEMLDEVVKHFPEDTQADEEDDRPKIAIVGKPNVGKSSIINKMVGEQRVIVSDIAGTTRDAIDSPFTWNDKEYTLIDTAGIRRKRSVEDETVERYSVIRSLAAIRRCDIALIVVDAERGLSEQDVRIAGYVHEEGKASVLIVNKWDLIEKDTYTAEKFKKKMLVDLAFMSYVPMLFISAKTGQRVNKVMELAEFAYEQNCTRISTGKLNDIISEAVTMNEPPVNAGRRLRVYYSTQAGIKPPTFIIFVNEPELMHFSYRRYLENYIRKSFEIKATPIRIIIRKRERSDTD